MIQKLIHALLFTWYALFSFSSLAIAFWGSRLRFSAPPQSQKTETMAFVSVVSFGQFLRETQLFSHFEPLSVVSEVCYGWWWLFQQRWQWQQQQHKDGNGGKFLRSSPERIRVKYLIFCVTFSMYGLGVLDTFSFFGSTCVVYFRLEKLNKVQIKVIN